MNFFITNREIVTSGDRELIREDGREHAGDNLRFGTYDAIKRDFTLFPEPATAADKVYEDACEKSVDELTGSAKFFRLIYDELVKSDTPGKNDVLFFIHGFNTDLESVRKTFDRLTENYVLPLNSPVKHIVIFTWPGRRPAVPFHYFDDRKDAIRSGEAFARAIEKVMRFFKEFLAIAGNEPCNRNIHLMAHSMGNRVLKHMLLELQSRNVLIPELFKEILLMAADTEYDIFERGDAFNVLIDLGSRVHTYFNKADRVLDISKFTKNFSNRLGRYGRKRIDLTLSDVFDADVTLTMEDNDADTQERLLRHWYYYTSKEVIADVIQVFHGEKSIYVVYA